MMRAIRDAYDLEPLLAIRDIGVLSHDGDAVGGAGGSDLGYCRRTGKVCDILVLIDFVVFEKMRQDWRKPLPGD